MSDAIRTQFWNSLEISPLLMVALNDQPMHSLPMHAVLDKHANHAIWFYTATDNRLAPGGRAMAQFMSKGHDLFACIAGTIARETDPAVIDRYWSRHVEAWFDQGRNDPRLLMLRFDLGEAEIWTADPGVTGTFKMIAGLHMTPQEAGQHEHVVL